MIISEIAGLTHADRVIEPIGMLTFGRVLFPTEFAVA
jgi:hypothetical protein